jgi:orotidine-5'-phosphate decarboxylase
MGFIEKLGLRAREANSWLCVGLDPVIEKIPGSVGTGAGAVAPFLSEIISATSEAACAFKVNLAFFESSGSEGWRTLEAILKSLPTEAVLIADGKRGDIGNTSRHYAKALFDGWDFDAATVNPYLGMDALEPFLEYREKGVFVLCLTSNPGASDFQRLQAGGEPLYRHVARKVVSANGNGNAGLVVGATQAEDLPSLREIAPSLPFLIPGIGAQGGDLAASIRFGSDKSGNGALINASRSILYASSGKDFGDKAREAAFELREEINRYRMEKRG